ncbi:hypothetical protein [Pararhodobacter sp. SW119]|uniref:hypothetical protein n=1 Tax=Pararhodobacter sp. SW119 TaxID=2780075 RepID=UPI001ADFDCED|nr:hypothetical protein [Pararhodobacter sp. SW119]
MPVPAAEKDQKAAKGRADGSAKTVAQHAITVVGTVVLALSLVWMLLGAGQGFQLEMDGLKPKLVVAAREEALGRVIDAALVADARETHAILQARDFHQPDSIPLETIPTILDSQLDIHAVLTRALLRDRGFFRVSDPALITALANLSPTDPASGQLRQMLFNLEGPFARPNTLDGARGRFITEVLESRPADDTLVAEIWSGFIAQSLSFLYPELRANLVPSNMPVRLQIGEGGNVVWNAAACNGSDLSRKFLQLWQETPDGAMIELPVTVFVRETLPINHCRGEPLKLIDIARAREAKLGLPNELHASLMAEASSIENGRLRFSFAIFPAGVAPSAPPEPPQQSGINNGHTDADAG